MTKLLLLASVFSLFSCSHSTKRENSKRDTMKKLTPMYLDTCPKEGDCSVSSTDKIAHAYCTSKGFDSMTSYTLKKHPSETGKFKMRLCDLKDSTETIRCEWSYPEKEVKDIQVFDKVICHRQKDSETVKMSPK